MQDCQRYWTVGGVLRNVPPGSGRRKSRSAASREHRKASASNLASSTLETAPTSEVAPSGPALPVDLMQSNPLASMLISNLGLGSSSAPMSAQPARVPVCAQTDATCTCSPLHRLCSMYSTRVGARRCALCIVDHACAMQGDTLSTGLSNQTAATTQCLPLASSLLGGGAGAAPMLVTPALLARLQAGPDGQGNPTQPQQPAASGEAKQGSAGAPSAHLSSIPSASAFTQHTRSSEGPTRSTESQAAAHPAQAASTEQVRALSRCIYAAAAAQISKSCACVSCATLLQLKFNLAAHMALCALQHARSLEAQQSGKMRPGSPSGTAGNAVAALPPANLQMPNAALDASVLPFLSGAPLMAPGKGAPQLPPGLYPAPHQSQQALQVQSQLLANMAVLPASAQVLLAQNAAWLAVQASTHGVTGMPDFAAQQASFTPPPSFGTSFASSASIAPNGQVRASRCVWSCLQLLYEPSAQLCPPAMRSPVFATFAGRSLRFQRQSRVGCQCVQVCGERWREQRTPGAI